MLIMPQATFANETNINYKEIILQAETIKAEAESLTQALRKLDPDQENMIGASSVTSFTSLITGIEDTIKKLGELIDTARELANNTNRQITQTGTTVRISLSELTTTMQRELSMLNVQLTGLVKSVDSTVQSTDKTIQTVNATMRNVNSKVSQTSEFISSFGGRVSSSYYFGDGGLDSSADIVLWRENRRVTAPQHSYLRLTLDGVDNSENREFSAILGTTRGWFSIGAGYIQDGFGLDLATNQFGDNGFDSRLSLYRMRELGLNTEIGYRPQILNGTRIFIFGEDLLKDDRSGGGGIAYERKF